MDAVEGANGPKKRTRRIRKKEKDPAFKPTKRGGAASSDSESGYDSETPPARRTNPKRSASATRFPSFPLLPFLSLSPPLLPLYPPLLRLLPLPFSIQSTLRGGGASSDSDSGVNAARRGLRVITKRSASATRFSFLFPFSIPAY